ncbi:MAG: shikimate kinase [Chitinophagales bacterium]|nr:shikimate kinase [Chitinophagales bacterium]
MKIFLIGMMGSGKSFLGKQIAGKLQLSMFDLDNLIEAKEKSSIEEIFSKKGEKYFREIETKILRSFSNEESFVLATGGGAACFNNNMEWMNEEGITVWLNETIDIITERLLNEKKQRPLIKNIKDDELKEFLKELLEERNQFYKQNIHLVVKTT